VAEYQTSIEIAASPQTVFDYLTTEAGMTAWMGQHADLDPQPAGRFAVDIAGFPSRGEYLHVERPTRVVVSWGVAGSEDLPVGASTVDFRLTATETGTRVDLVHSGLPDTGLAGHADGWEHFLPRLAVAAVGGDAGPDRWRPIGESEPPTTIKEGQTL
jgi:uncharacterized protein YndB with AHSA1/START domain